MAVTSEPDNTPLPGTVFTPRQVRGLKIAVIVMGILLVGGFALVMAAIVYQASKLGDKKVQAPAAGQASAPAEASGSALALPRGATIASMALDGDLLALHLQTSTGPEIAVIDVTTGRVLSRIKIDAD
ncbi:MAG: hypothetical protein ACSLE4_01530 [Methyloceanibacter sp.]|uniref:hypothetical protein n=1 Tax=Methyloceanibacter sp. TaxID=1965321 RepID=UPI003EDF2C46